MIRPIIATILALLPSVSTGAGAQEWSSLPPLTDPLGFAGPFAGVSDGSMLVAGGANFPDGPPWSGGAKVWHDRVFALDQMDGTWRDAGKLDHPIAYGTSLTSELGVLCLGGSDATRHYATCSMLRRSGEGIEAEALPPLPRPLAYTAGALVGSTVYLVGGTTTPQDTSASNSLYSLDLIHTDKGWKELEPLPAAGRILSVAASHDGSFYLFSGASLAPDAEGNPVRTYLNESWRYHPDHGWEALATMPRAAVAAPSPAPTSGASQLLIIGGDDGTLSNFEPKSEHPGFTREILAYDTLTNTWGGHATLPNELLSPVTTPTVYWQGRTIIPSGEVRPAVRSPQILSFIPSSPRASFGALNWTIVGAYLTAMIGVGVWFMKREASGSTEAYFRGGQRIPAWVAGLSIFATMLSALTFMGIPARAFQTDITWYIGQLPILIIVPIVSAFYLPYFRKLDLTSAYEYLEKRFNLPCRIFASLSFILFHLGRIAIVLYLPALALAAVSNIDVVTAILVIGVLCLIYTVIGGIEAVVWTDAIQALVLMGGALLCLILAAVRVDGGPLAIARIASEDRKLFENLQWTSFDITSGTTSAIVLFVAFFFNSFVSYTSSQDVVQRYVTTPDLATARRSLKITMWMSIFGSLIFFLLGIAIYAFYKTHPDQLDPTLSANDSILPFYVMQQLPVGISGLVIAAIFAAAQSTISSSLNSIATTAIKDIDSRILRPDRPDATYLRTAQGIVIVAGIVGIGVALWMANSNIESAFKTFNSLIGLTAGSLGGLFALGIFTRRAHGSAAFIAALIGFATVITLHFTGSQVSGLLYAFIGFGACFLIGILLSWLIPGTPSNDLLQQPNS